MTEEDKTVCRLLVMFAKLIQQAEEKGLKENGSKGQGKPTEKVATKFLEADRATDRRATRNLRPAEHQETANSKRTVKRDPEGRSNQNGL